MSSGGMALKGGGLFWLDTKFSMTLLVFADFNCFNRFPGKNAKLELLFFVTDDSKVSLFGIWSELVESKQINFNSLFF